MGLFFRLMSVKIVTSNVDNVTERTVSRALIWIMETEMAISLPHPPHRHLGHPLSPDKSIRAFFRLVSVKIVTSNVDNVTERTVFQALIWIMETEMAIPLPLPLIVISATH